MHLESNTCEAFGWFCMHATVHVSGAVPSNGWYLDENAQLIK